MINVQHDIAIPAHKGRFTFTIPGKGGAVAASGWGFMSQESAREAGECALRALRDQRPPAPKKDTELTPGTQAYLRRFQDIHWPAERVAA